MSKLIYLIPFLFILSNNSNAQKLSFQYDSYGNQVKREYVIVNRIANNIKPEKSPTSLEFKSFFEGDRLSYYPNPVQDNLSIRWNFDSQTSVKEITLNDINGRVLNTFKINSTEKIFNTNLSNYPQGIYFLNLSLSDNQTETIKIIKE